MGIAPTDRPVWLYYYGTQVVTNVHVNVLDYDDKGVTVKNIETGERWWLPNTSIQRIVIA